MTENFGNLGQILENLSPIRLRLLTSIEKESAIPEFISDVRTKLDLEDLALYFVNPERQILERGSRLGIYRFKEEKRQTLPIDNSVPGKAVLSGKTLFEALLKPPLTEKEIGREPRGELCIPIKIDEQVVGVLDLLTSIRLSEYHQQVLEFVVADLAVALTNLRTVKKLKKQIGTDEATGLYNAHHFLEHLEIEIKRSNRNDSLLGILFLELDDVAGIKLKLGNVALDEAMQQVAQLLKKNSRITDLLARFSDMAFALSLGGTDIDKSLFVAEKLRKLIAQESFQDLGGPLTVSVGVAVYPLHAVEREELIFMAQQAARLAKYNGGNQVSVIGSDRMKLMALKVFAGILSDKHFQTGPQAADEVASYLEDVSSDPVFSPLAKQIVESLASAIDAKDHYTKSHSEEATVYAEALGRACHLTEKQLELVKMAAKLHDLGKIGVPEQILNKCGPLDEQEWKIMREHPSIGAKILEPIESLADLVPIVQCHHERWNGSGYPAGLKGIAIPLAARIIGVIDSFHAIISERPYKRAFPVSYALDQLRNQAGTNFDPSLIDRFCSIIDTNGNIQWPEETKSSSSSPAEMLQSN